jgi:kynureninase
MTFENSLEFASSLDSKDPLNKFRNQFHIPKINGKSCIYLCGNSLGLQPITASQYVHQELVDWANLGVEGHFHARNPWMPYHEYLTKPMAELVGAEENEVVVMNSLTVNLHLLMVSFYRPSKSRYKIVIEQDAFPSDRYAVASQVEFHGYDPATAIIEWKSKDGSRHPDLAGLSEILDNQGDQVALIFFGGVNYYTGQLYPIDQITQLGHEYGCMVGTDLAHAAGNVELTLHKDNVDFAAWCSYKYLNSGPGSLSGVFVHDRHAERRDLSRFAGWWGHNKSTRFNMRYDFDPIPGAEGWQLSNPPILPMAAMRASLDLFTQAGISNLRQKSIQLTAYLEYLLTDLSGDSIDIITPSDPEQRGCQLSLYLKNGDKRIHDELSKQGVISDWREPNVIRIAPTPLYNTFEDVYRFTALLNDLL